MCEFLDREKEIQVHGDKLPHWQQDEVMQFVTFRLGDAMPASKLDRWREERELWEEWHPKPWNEKTQSEHHRKFSARLEKWLDQGHGSCLLSDKKSRGILEAVLQYDEGDIFS